LLSALFHFVWAGLRAKVQDGGSDRRFRLRDSPFEKILWPPRMSESQQDTQRGQKKAGQKRGEDSKVTAMGKKMGSASAQKA